MVYLLRIEMLQSLKSLFNATPPAATEPVSTVDTPGIHV